MLINTFHNATYSTKNTPRPVVATPSFRNSVDKPSTDGASFVMAYLYRHIRLDKNEPFYIGIGTDNRYKRAHERARRSDLWKKIVAKTNYEVEILMDGIPWNIAKQRESEFIKLYGRKDLGTGTLANMTDGGDGTLGKPITEEYRMKLSRAAKNRVISEDQKNKLREISLKRNFTEEQKIAISEKISKIHKGRKLSQHHIGIMSARMQKEKNPMYGKKATESPNFKGFIEAYKDGILVGTYSGVHYCAKELNAQATKISACINGKRNIHKGYTYKRV
jgi:hypothetical protein